MDLQISAFLLFILFTGGQSLRCYECTSLNGSCADQTVTTCPELSTCFSSTAVTATGDNEAKFKGCAPSHVCPSISSTDITFFCCNKDLCNAKDAELSGGSSSNVIMFPNFSNFLNISNVLIVPNGKKCYYCDGQNCSKIMSCSGSEDHCVKGTETYGGRSVVVKGCASKSICDFASLFGVESVSCCEGNLCNSAQSVSQSFLFLCCSLLSYFLLH
ncbi:Urokinase plasminogen activator surface receptor [Anabarilius grahami]|uniref:Urokinase plasminogen activator surface receptor n=1 Tax=Anabarilius grahami TaxID=495550 RepID=A0A3N0XST6_ANAGA|nr:Urokinase plasminogen activator surface receptor [Anabarilius grahami]